MTEPEQIVCPSCGTYAATDDESTETKLVWKCPNPLCRKVKVKTVRVKAAEA